MSKRSRSRFIVDDYDSSFDEESYEASNSTDSSFTSVSSRSPSSVSSYSSRSPSSASSRSPSSVSSRSPSSVSSLSSSFSPLDYRFSSPSPKRKSPVKKRKSPMKKKRSPRKSNRDKKPAIISRWVQKGNFALAHIGGRVSAPIKKHIFDMENSPLDITYHEIAPKTKKCDICGEAKRKVYFKGEIEGEIFYMGNDCETKLAPLIQIREILDEIKTHRMSYPKMQEKEEEMENLLEEFKYANKNVRDKYMKF